jgi:carbonic anhydrase
MTVTDELLEAADRYAASFDKGELPLPPARHVAIVACMDARLNVYGLLGLTEGDAHVIRNAGGCATADTLRSLRLSQIVGGTREILLVHHEDCAALAETGTDPDADLRECVELVRTSNELPHTEMVRGFVYTRGGALREIRSERRAENPR